VSVVSSVVHRTFRVTDPGTGVGVTGLTSANFTLASYKRPYGGAWATYAASIAIAEIADGWYGLTFTNPSTAGYRLVTIKANVPASHKLNISAIDGEVMTQDLATIFAATARPVVRIASTGSVGQTVPLSMVAKRWFQRTFTFVDSSGDPITLLSTYGSFRISVRAKDQDDPDAFWDGTDLVADDAGNLVVTIPEDADFFDALPEPTLESQDTVVLRYEIAADYNSEAAKTVSLVPSSQLTLTRYEVGTTL
jgi:hypothetical protein